MRGSNRLLSRSRRAAQSHFLAPVLKSRNASSLRRTPSVLGAAGGAEGVDSDDSRRWRG